VEGLDRTAAKLEITTPKADEYLLLDEGLHIIEPFNIFSLLLVVDIFKQEGSQFCINSSLFKVLLEHGLEVGVKVANCWTSIQTG